MKTVLTILFSLFLVQTIFAQTNTAPGFLVNTTSNASDENSTLGGSAIYYMDEEINMDRNLIFISRAEGSDFLVLEINTNDKKNYNLELIDEEGDVIVALEKFNSGSIKLIKNNLHAGTYSVQLTDTETNKVHRGNYTFM